MTQGAKLTLEWFEGLPPKNHRGLAWITSRPANTDINGKDSYEALPATPEQRQFLSRLDSWLEWKTKKQWYHGWSEDGYKDLFQFTYNEYRLMGFLCHPDTEDRRFQLCALVLMTTKFTKHTDKRLKNFLQDLADSLNMEQLFKNLQ